MNVHPGSLLFKLLSAFEEPWKLVAPETFEAHKVRKRCGFEGTWHVYPPQEKRHPWSVVDFDPTPYEARIAMSLSTTCGTGIPTVEIAKDVIELRKNDGSCVRSGVVFELRRKQRDAIQMHALKIAEAIKMSEVWVLERLLGKKWVDFLILNVFLETYVRRAEELKLQDQDCFDDEQAILDFQFKEELKILSKFFKRSA